MKPVALLFPGQGAQKVGMGQDFYQASPEAKAVFDQADEVLGNGLSDVIFNGPQEKLTETAYCQPGIMTMSLAALMAFRASDAFKNIDVKFTAGLSLGEYSALVAAGNLSLKDGLSLVQKRSAFMDEATQQANGAMAAVIGLGEEKIIDICEQTGAEVANFNAPDQIVITGDADNVKDASALIAEAGAKRVIPLDVAGAFHSSLMQPAADRFEAGLANISVQRSDIIVISNVDGLPETEDEHIKANLAKQITSSVQWVKSIEYIASKGVTEFIEIGPGTVLKGLLRRISRDLKVQNIETMDDIAKLDL